MPGQIRPNEKLAKVAYEILKTSKDSRQKNTELPTERQRREWAATYNKSLAR